MLVKGLKVVEILDVQGRGARAGIKQGDVLIKVNDLQLERVEDLTGFMASHLDKKYCTLSMVTAKDEFKLIDIEVGTLGLSLAPIEIIENFNSRLYEDIENNKKHRKQEIELNNAINSVLISTTSNLEGYKVIEHIDLIATAMPKNRKDTSNAINQAIVFNLKKEAYRRGANAIIGAAFNFPSYVSGGGSGGHCSVSSYLSYHLSGTAVIVEKIKDS